MISGNPATPRSGSKGVSSRQEFVGFGPTNSVFLHTQTSCPCSCLLLPHAGWPQDAVALCLYSDYFCVPVIWDFSESNEVFETSDIDVQI